MLDFSGSLRYDPSGRKRKTKAHSTRSRSRSRAAQNSGVYVPSSLPPRALDSSISRERYPSKEVTASKDPSIDTSWKIGESKNFTVAPAYNKGAYQVIPRNNIKDIGR